MKVKTEELTPYQIKKPDLHAEKEMTALFTEQAIIKTALLLLDSKLRHVGISATSPQEIINYLRLTLDEKDDRKEVFGVVFLNSKNKVLNIKILNEGTIDQTAVYPREVLEEVFKTGATSIILFHTHPSYDPNPSMHDHKLTSKLKEVCGALSINVHDHIIIAGNHYYSFAEQGQL